MRQAELPSTTIAPTSSTPAEQADRAISLDRTIDRLKAMVADAGDRLLLSDGPPHPDHCLLDACADALRIMREVKELRQQDRALFSFGGGDFAQLPVAEQERRREQSKDNLQQIGVLDGALRSVLSIARKQPATTAAGVYAKALVCKTSQTGAAVLAMTLAEDLIATPAIRASIWPAGAGGAS